jgi:hypothetical protein
MEHQEKFSDNPEENMRIENELLRIKLKAQFGEAFQMGMGEEEIPPEIENQFLKNVLAFEEAHVHTEYTTVYKRIGMPAYKPVAALTKGEMKTAAAALLSLLQENNINLDFCDGPYDEETVYRFITEEFFDHEVEKEAAKGMSSCFIYEEFHPNHKDDIEKRTHEFLQHFFTASFNEHSIELGDEIITADGQQLTKEQLLKKMQLYFDAYESLANDAWTTPHIQFELKEEEGRGMGFAEGGCKYDAVLDNKETLHFEGPYKIYMGMQYGIWQVFYFVLPGFKW